MMSYLSQRFLPFPEYMNVPDRAIIVEGSHLLALSQRYNGAHAMYPPPPPPQPGIMSPMEAGLLFVIGLIAVLMLLSISVAVEATVLAILKWNRFLRSLGVALLMNLASGALGSAFLYTMNDLVDLDGVTLLVTLFVGFYLLSIPVEFGVLTLFRKDALRHNFVAALIVNTVSCGLIGALILPLILLPYGISQF